MKEKKRLLLAGFTVVIYSTIIKYQTLMCPSNEMTAATAALSSSEFETPH